MRLPSHAADAPPRVSAGQGVSGARPSALVSTRRGQPSNHRYPARSEPDAGTDHANYADFGPTLACEKLAERHGIHLGSRRSGNGCWLTASGATGGSGSSRCTSRAIAGTASANSCRSTAPSMVVRGPRPAVHALGVRRRRDEPSYAPAFRADRVRPLTSSKPRGLPAAPRKPWRSTPTSTACSGQP